MIAERALDPHARLGLLALGLLLPR